MYKEKSLKPEDNTPIVKTYYQMSEPVYKALEKSLLPPSAPTNPIEAGFLLGIQHVLIKLRAGYIEV